MVAEPADPEIVLAVNGDPEWLRHSFRSFDMVRLLGVGLALCAVPLSLAAQECRPGAESNEAKTLAIFAVPLAFGPGAAPATQTRVTLGIEAARVPTVDPATATPTICRPGKGPENTELLPGLARPRIGIPLPFGLAFEASWIPPVRVNGVRANLIGFALAKSLRRGNGLTAAIRGHATFGSVHAPVTCDRSATGDSTSECFHGRVSDDRLSPNVVGLDASVGWSMAGGRLHPYLGSGYSRLLPRFQVNFTNQFGGIDTTRVEVNLDRVVFFGGAEWQLTGRLAITGEVYAVAPDAATGRLVIRRAFGHT
jgi:hypothetical protein